MSLVVLRGWGQGGPGRVEVFFFFLRLSRGDRGAGTQRAVAALVNSQHPPRVRGVTFSLPLFRGGS